MSPYKRLCILICCLPLIAGCWDSIEVEERGFVTGIAIDFAISESETPSNEQKPNKKDQQKQSQNETPLQKNEGVLNQNTLIENVKGLKDIFGDSFEEVVKEQIIIIKKISGHIEGINANVHAMIDERKKANSLSSIEEMAHAYCDNVKPYFDVIRYHADKLELEVDNELWTLTKYRELLFTK